MDLIIIGIIIYSIYKKYNKTSFSNIRSILQKNGFHSIYTVEQNSDNFVITASLNGENYIIKTMLNNSSVTNSTIHSLVEKATKLHYHNIVLIPGNAVISGSAKPLINKYNIAVWDNSKLNQFSTSSKSDNISTIVKTSPIHDTCKISDSEEPIQDGSKANSIWGNFFGNKIEKL